MTSKIDRAVELLKANSTLSRTEVIDLFVRELGMSKAGASTYFYNAKAKSGIETVVKAKAPKVKAAKAAKIVKGKARTTVPKKDTKVLDEVQAKVRAEFDAIEKEAAAEAEDLEMAPNGLVLVPKGNKKNLAKIAEAVAKMKASGKIN